MTDIPDKAVEAAVKAYAEQSGDDWDWISAESMRAALSAASPFMGAVPQEATAEPVAPCNLPDPSASDCKNMKEVGGGFEGERYRCAVCGKGYFLDYEDMK